MEEEFCATKRDAAVPAVEEGFSWDCVAWRNALDFEIIVRLDDRCRGEELLSQDWGWTLNE